jgi:UrcA family protein
MNKTATAIRALTVCAIAILGFNTAKASTADVPTDLSLRNATRTYTVRFADLNVSTFEGAKALYARLGHAAKVVCEPLESAPSFGSTQYERCISKAVADAVASVNRPLVSQYHQSRTKSDKARGVELAKAN